jgi:NADH:ubiquinone oxidoreductase subunit
MAATFNWSIANTERYLDTGGIFVVHWRVTAEETVGDDTFTASAYGTVGFTPDPDADDFVAYDSLTEATVLGWVHAEVDQDATEAALTANIEAQKNPVSADGMPW